MGQQRTRILFVCMGNICRSPLAEGVFRNLAVTRGLGDRFLVDSAGTGAWHVGDPPDPRVRAVAERHGVSLDSAGRQVHVDDFERFDHVICMDKDNRRNLLTMGAPPEKVSLLLDHDPQARLEEVPDPYYGGPAGFEQSFELVESACGALLDTLTSES